MDQSELRQLNVEDQEMFVVPGIYSVPGIHRMWYSYLSRLFYFQFDRSGKHTLSFNGEYLLLMIDTDPMFDNITPEGQQKVKDFVKRIYGTKYMLANA